MIQRDLALTALRSHVTPHDLVVAVYQSCFDWLALCPRDLNYVSTGAMGQASSHALGLALGSPDRQVIILDGDGSLLMNLGSLVTIGNVQPRKFVHLVFENGVYEVNGAHPIPGAGMSILPVSQRQQAIKKPHAFTIWRHLSAHCRSCLLARVQ